MEKENFNKRILKDSAFRKAVDALDLRYVKGVGRSPSYLERKGTVELPY